jgi:hypothetical protein
MNIFSGYVYISFLNSIKKKKNHNKPKQNQTETGVAGKYNLKIRINIVIFHCFIIILVTSRKRFIVVKMTFNLKRTNETRFTYDMHVMHVYFNNICFFFSYPVNYSILRRTTDIRIRSFIMFRVLKINYIVLIEISIFTYYIIK